MRRENLLLLVPLGVGVVSPSGLGEHVASTPLEPSPAIMDEHMYRWIYEVDR